MSASVRVRRSLSGRVSKLFRLGVAGVVGALVASSLVVLPASAQGPAGVVPDPPPPGVSVPVKPVPVKPVVSQDEVAKADVKTPPVFAWPVGGAAVVPVEAGGVASARAAPVVAGGLPVVARVAAGVDAPRTVGELQAQAVAGGGPSQVRVVVSGRSAADAVGVHGVLLQVARADAAASAGAVGLTVDYSAFANASGGNYGARLRLVSLPACALTTPALAACQVQTPVDSVNDPVARTVSAASLPVAGDPTVAAQSTQDGSAQAASTSGGLVYALAAGSSSAAGDWTKTPLSAAGSWSQGGASGDFTYQVPLKVPASLGGPTPNLALTYSSGSVDGKSSATNTQASWVGDGWTFDTAYITRSYASCADDGNNTGDMCWLTQGGKLSETVNLVMDGHSSQLVKDEATGLWKMVDDDAWVVNLFTGAVNLDNNGEWWQLIAPDGTRYQFGANHFAGVENTWSVSTVPVFGNDTGEPCHSSNGFSSSSCNQAYRWSVDRVIDTRDNTMTYFYDLAQKKYGWNNGAGVREYTADTWLVKVEYGTRLGQEGLSPMAPMQVLTGREDRCSSMATCDLDVPTDVSCELSVSSCSVKSPGFFSNKKLVRVEARVWDGALVPPVYAPVDAWDLTHDYPDAGGGTGGVLWLRTVTHTGYKLSGALAEPAMRFDGISLANRIGGSQALNRFRINGINNGVGGQIGVAFHAPNCNASNLPDGNANNNTLRCYPQFWAPAGGTAGFGWFQKYVLNAVYAADLTGGGPAEWWYYEYYTAGSTTPVLWHHDDPSEQVPLSRRTWSQWRGYPTVRTLHGTTGSMQTMTDTRYFRGMDGDRAGPSGGSRPAKVDGLVDFNPLQGRVSSTHLYGDGVNVIDRTFHVYTPVETGLHTRQWWPNQLRSYLTRETQTKHETYIATATPPTWRTTQTNTVVDAYGLPTKIFNYGDAAIIGDDTCTKVDYTTRLVSPGSGEYRGGYPYQVTTVDDATTCNGGVLRQSQTFYDEHPSLTQTPGRGLATKVLALTSSTGPDTWSTTETKYETVYGRVIETTDPLGRKTTTAYTPATGGPLTKVVSTNPKGHTTTSNLDLRRGQPLTVVDANGKTTTAVYDPLGRLIGVWKPNRVPGGTAADVSYTYQLSATTANSVTTKVRGGAPGQPIGIVLASIELYDGLLRPRQTQTASIGASGGRVVNDIRYDSRGLPVAGATFWNSSSPVSDLAGFTDTDVDIRSVTVYDNVERPIRAEQWSKATKLWQTQTQYDGDHTTVIPPDGGATVTNVDALGQTIALDIYPTAATTGGKERTTYTYDRLGQLTHVTDPATNVSTYGYDRVGRRETTTDPDTGTSRTTYDAAGQVTFSIDGRGQKISHEYDELGRELTRWAGEIETGTKLATFAYDSLPNAKGMPTSSTRWVGSDQYTVSIDGYNDRYQPTGKTWIIPMTRGALAGTYKIGYEYSEVGNLAKVTYPAGGGLAAETVEQSYDRHNTPTTLEGKNSSNVTTSYVTGTTYSGYGELTQRVYGTSGAAQLTRNYTYEASTGRLSNITSKLPNTAQPGQFTTVQNDTYTRTATGDITSILDGTDNQAQCYRHDGQHRLTDAWTATSNCSTNPTDAAIAGSGKYPYWDNYAYDTAGRRWADTHRDATSASTRTVKYPLTGSRPVHAAEKVTYTGAISRIDNMTYDNAGNTLKRTINGVITDFHYNTENQFDRATVHATGGDQVTSHFYDATGELLIREEPGGTTLYAAGQEYKAVGGTVTATRYYSHGGAAVAVRTPTGLSWLAADHQASANLTVNATTGAVQRRWYTPYGDNRATQGTWPTDRGFLNKPTNTSTSLIDVGAREYDPNLGTFLTPDPLISPTNPTTYNAYVYAGHNPITNSDPSGLSWVSSTWEIGKSFVSGLAEPFKDTYNATKAELGLPIYLINDAADYATGRKTGSEWVDSTKDRFVDAAEGGLNIVAGVATAATGQGQFEAGAGSVKKVYDGGKKIAQGDVEGGLSDLAHLGGSLTTTVALSGLPIKGLPKGLKGPKTGETGGTPKVGCNSFALGTPVLMADGSTKRIEQIGIGDEVSSTDTDTWSTEPNTVTELHRNYDTDLTDLRLAANDESFADVHTTQEHPFWSETRRRWVDAGALQVGEVVHTLGGAVERVVSRVNRRDATWMYNLTVVSFHTYYVIVGTTPVLVHNANCSNLFKGDGYQHTLHEHVDGSPGVAPNNTTFSNYLELDDIAGLIEDTSKVRGTPNTRDPITGLPRDGTIHRMDFGYPVGSRGETSVEVILNPDGSLRTAYPR